MIIRAQKHTVKKYIGRWLGERGRVREAGGFGHRGGQTIPRD